MIRKLSLTNTHTQRDRETVALTVMHSIALCVVFSGWPSCQQRMINYSISRVQFSFFFLRFSSIISSHLKDGDQIKAQKFTFKTVGSRSRVRGSLLFSSLSRSISSVSLQAAKKCVHWNYHQSLCQTKLTEINRISSLFLLRFLWPKTSEVKYILKHIRFSSQLQPFSISLHWLLLNYHLSSFHLNALHHLLLESTISHLSYHLTLGSCSS